MLQWPEKLENHLLVEAKSTKLDAINGCVLKVYFKKKYIIVKGKTAVGGLKCIFRAMNGYNREKSNSLPEDNLNKHFVKYFWNESRGWTFRIKILIESATSAELLKKEQFCLWESKNDQNCLNNTVDAYIPIYREETASYGWMNKGSVLTFLKWKKRMLPVLMPAMSEI